MVFGVGVVGFGVVVVGDVGGLGVVVVGVV